MREKDTLSFFASWLAMLMDSVAIYGGLMLAYWVRFYSGWLEVTKGYPLHEMYYKGAVVSLLVHLLVFRSLGLYERPQLGSFTDKIPRLVRAIGLSLLLSMVLTVIFKPEPPFSRLAIGLAFFTVSALVLMLRWIGFRLEVKLTRKHQRLYKVLILGVDKIAPRVSDALKGEKHLRSRVVGYLRTSDEEPSEKVEDELILGGLDDLSDVLVREKIDQVVLTDISIGHEQIVDIIFLCEKNLVTFNLVPDLFRVLTSGVDVQTIGGIPFLGLRKWPLDYFHNRMLKRAEDILGSLIGLLIAAPIIGIAALLVKRSSPGPVFYRQTRCGEEGKTFTLYKLRTMPVDAEAESGPVWTSEDDPRRTRIGGILRKWNLDELPQFFNVLRGEMSLVGPRPERPHFVEQFKEDIERYMSRHVSKPGLTGWAQVNGFRGNTSIHDRIKYDLFYLEYWSLALDFKILVRTLFSRENAY